VLSKERNSCIAAAAALLASICLLASLSLPPEAGAQTSWTDSAERADAPASRAELEGLERRVESQSDDSDRIFNVLVFLVAILTGGGAVGVVLSFRNEQRQGESHGLAMKGEAKAQERAEETHDKFLRGSQETLNLVNQTLSLAKDASERAEKATKEKANEQLEGIDKSAKAVLAEAFDAGDFKVVVRDPIIEERLKSIGKNIMRTEGHAGLHGLKLSPRCLFAKGLEGHLDSMPEQAIESWEEAAEAAGEPELSAFALYWVGYERNNIGEFSRAATAFHSAHENCLTDKDQAQHYELKRMEIRARFFDSVAKGVIQAERRPAIQGFIDGLEGLITSLPAHKRLEFDEERRLCEEAIGELLLWSARLSPHERKSGEEFNSPEKKALEEALDHFEEAGNGVWAVFGRAQAQWALGGSISDHEYASLRMGLHQGDSHREARTVALRHAATLIAEKEHGDSSGALAITSRELRMEIQRVNERLTVFSPWQKRNVSHELFKREVELYHDPHDPSDASAGPFTD
jgi:tetratricopeptide (TPR) repeat protein